VTSSSMSNFSPARIQSTQKTLSGDQIKEFYHDQFVDDQTRHFVKLLGATGSDGVVVDVGGGCGFFARLLMDSTPFRVRVVDSDDTSIEGCRRIGVEAVRGDALAPDIRGDERIVVLNLILHHLVGRSEATTRELQSRALAVWLKRATSVFVNEYIYESFVDSLSGRLIFEITASAFLSTVGRLVSRFVPALRANTFNVGVRFRSHDEWRALFTAAGYAVKSVVIGEPERVSPVLRLLLIKQIRRDSFLLEPRIGATQ
jgi:hypothetical protein